MQRFLVSVGYHCVLCPSKGTLHHKGHGLLSSDGPRTSSQLTAAFYVLWSKPITKQTNIIPITAFHLHIRLPLDYIHVHLSYHGDRIHLLANRRSEKVNTFNPYNRGGRRHSHTTRIPLPPCVDYNAKKGGPIRAQVRA